jgi:hypothetical protein
MNPLAANRTAARPPVAMGGRRISCSFVEDLNWPSSQPVPDKKAPRPTEVWVPGRNGQWDGATPTLQ